jgi:hypothetical protein
VNTLIRKVNQAAGGLDWDASSRLEKLTCDKALQILEGHPCSFSLY